MKLRNKKSGQVVDWSFVGPTAIKEYGDEDVLLDRERYESIEEFISEWEDYKPAEPLIKDEKIRKAVRAWAEVNSIKEAMYAERPDRSLCLLVDMGEDDYNIDFVGWIPTLKDSKSYTIAELCGEEEE